MTVSSTSRRKRQAPVQLTLIPGTAERLRAKPFLKWAGGKTFLLKELIRRRPPRYNRYFEPFLGGGALLFELQPLRAFVSDSNPDLINAYQAVKDNVEQLIRSLRKHVHSEEYFYRMRNADRRPSFKRWSVVSRAGRLIYLNKTCYNGLYRVNSLGQFNVPFGRYDKPKWLDETNLRACSTYLQNVRLSTATFETAVKEARKNDFVYFDPPYAPLTATSDFTAYTTDGFSGEDQVKLRDVCRKLNRRGVYFMLSNSAAPQILELYSEFNLQFVQAPRFINSKAAHRGKIKEVIVTNY